MKLLGVGHALADTFAFVDEDVPKTMGLHPGSFNTVPDYRMTAILSTLRQKAVMAGGSAANVVKLASRLGVRSHFVGQCGLDEPGQVFERELLGANVTVHLTKSDAPTGHCVTFLVPSQSRTVATFRSASGNLPQDLVGDNLLAESDVVVVEGYLLDEPDFLRSLTDRALTAGKVLAFDTADGSLVERHGDFLKQLLQTGAIRYLFLQESEAATLTGLDAEGALGTLSRMCGTVVLRRGDRGWLVRSGDKVVAVPLAGSVSVDPSGSGDGFEAGFLWGLSQNWDTLRSCRAGSLVAGCVVQQPGTRVDDVRWAQLVKSLDAIKN